MIVQYMSFVIKPGRRREAVELLQDMWKWLDLPITHRIYTAATGVWNRVIQEIEFVDKGAMDKFWADNPSRPEWAPFMEKWNELADSGSTIELLDLIE